MEKERQNSPLNESAKLLDSYLKQYKWCKLRKKRLEIRRNTIIREFESPLSAITYTGLPKGNNISIGAAGLAIRLDEIDSRIAEQQRSAAKFLLDAMNVLEFLPDNSIEREILEARYIDGASWENICKSTHMTRTPANAYWRKGIDKLLEFKKVQMILEEYRQQLDDTGEVI